MKSNNLFRVIVGTVFASLMVANAVADAKLSEVTAKKVGDGLHVEIKGEELQNPKVLRVMGGKSYLLEFQANLAKPQYLKVNHGGVSYVQSVWFKAKPPTVRVHLKVNPDSKIEVQESSAGWQVCVNCEDMHVEKRVEAVESVAKAEKPAAKLPTLPAFDPKTYTFTDPPKTVSNPPASNTSKSSSTMANLGAKQIDLNFVNTDIVLILKALAAQANVNIVTSPDVKGTLTVDMANVTVTEALDLVTTLSGLRYGKVGKTFVVASSANFNEMMRQIGGHVEESVETRVVPIYSGEGNQIKAAVLKSVPMRSESGSVEVVLPSEELKVQKTETIGGETTGTAGAAGAAGQGTQGTQGGTTLETRTAATASKDPYVVLIGPASKLHEVEEVVRRIDEQICRALGIEVPTSSAVTRATYYPQGSSAAALMRAVSGSTDASATRAKVGNVELFATPSDSISEQVIVLSGRETEVNQILNNLRALDTVGGQSSGDYLIYDVKYLDPRSLREALLVQVPGLSATIPPSSVGNPATFTSGTTINQATQQVGGNATVQGGGEQQGSQGGGQGSQVSVAGDAGALTGIQKPFKDFEQFGVPMKLVLRGSREQINRAIAYLEAIDVAPKQVALELRVMELSKEDALRVGLDWSLLTGGTVQNLTLSPGGGGTGNLSGDFGFAGGGTLSVTAQLDQLATNRNLIARPNLLAHDGRETEIFVGDVIRYIESIQATQNGITVTTGEVPVGVRLAVLPRIGGDNSITMDLRPVVSTLNSFTPVPGGGQLPQTSLRIAQSTMTIRDGETIAIGGLIQDQDRKTVSGIPLLKDLPLIGWLFKRTDTSRTRTEVVFFLSAKVVNKDNRANAANPRANEGGGTTTKVGN